ncbi:AAA family ATPase [Bradyrhizobium japonicum]|uniref:AAA family ATPase n=1 Tax=Bradyrhizobium japonicum TaxID=375 RepID=UPI00200CFFAC|nr:AAA family ATPase [Bradyrhizobium japonicum]UQD96076.1 AAA family ATPase [Bradyrhizobium japonicum]
MTEPPDDRDANDVLRSAGSDGLREMFDRAERKVIPLRDVVEPSQQSLLRPISMARWDHVAPPEPDWTVFQRIPRRQTALFSGEGAMGKSTLLLQLCAAHVVAKDWLHTMPEPGPAVFLDAEDDQDVMHRRLASVVRHYGVTFADLANGGLNLISMVGQDCILAESSKSGKVQPTALYNELLAFVGDVKPAMIGLASAANFFAGNENDRSEVQQFIGLCTRLAIVANGSTMLVSHPSNTGIATGSGVSGSTAWHNAVRSRIFLHGVKKQSDSDGGEPDNDLREIEFMKNNYGPRAERLTLRWQDGLFLPEKGKSSLQKAVQEQKEDEVFRELLQRTRAQNRTVGPNTGANYAPAIFADEPEAKGMGHARLKAAMMRLLRNGKISIEEYGPPSRRRSRLVIT